MKSFVVHACVFVFLLAGTRLLAAAETPVQTQAFTSSADGNFSDLLSGPIFVGTGHALDGYTRFNPALGTLTAIRFSVQVNARVSVTVSAQEVNDDQSPFTVLLEPGPTDVRQASLIYQPTGANFGRSVTFDNAQVNPAGGSNLNPGDWGAPGTFSYQDIQEESFGGYANGGSTPTTGELLASDPDVNLADFIGSGTVPGLRFDLLVQLENVGVLDNVPAGFVEVSVEFAAGEATLQYVYTPATSPVEPVLTGYTRSGNLHTLTFTGAAGRSNWEVKGDTTLGLFATDHSAQAVITELSTGTYRALLTLPGLNVPQYFFRVEE